MGSNKEHELCTFSTSRAGLMLFPSQQLPRIMCLGSKTMKHSSTPIHVIVEAHAACCAQTKLLIALIGSRTIPWSSSTNQPLVSQDEMFICRCSLVFSLFFLPCCAMLLCWSSAQSTPGLPGGRTCLAQSARPTPLHPAHPQTLMPVCACLATSQAASGCVQCVSGEVCPGGASGGAAVIECPPGATSPPGSDSTADCVCQPGYGKPIMNCIISSDC